MVCIGGGSNQKTVWAELKNGVGGDKNDVGGAKKRMIWADLKNVSVGIAKKDGGMVGDEK